MIELPIQSSDLILFKNLTSNSKPLIHKRISVMNYDRNLQKNTLNPAEMNATTDQILFEETLSLPCRDVFLK